MKKQQTPQPLMPEPQIKVDNNKPSSMLSSEPNIKFKLTAITLSGNRTIATAELAKLYKNKLNTEISLPDLEQIAQDITDYYRNADYILSQAIIPPQEIGPDGSVKLTVIEGFIDQIEVRGSTRSKITALLKEYGKRIQKVKPLTLSALERFAFLANDIPGSNVRVVITRSLRAVGGADLTFVVSEKNVAGNLVYNNHNSAVLGRQQIIANASIYNLTTASQTSINATVSRNIERLKYFALMHRQQLNSNGLSCNLAVSTINTNPNLEQIGLDGFYLPGKAITAIANLEYAKIRSHKRNLFIGGGFKFLNSHTKFGKTDLFKDDIRSVNIYATYNFLSGLNATYISTITLTQGINILNASGNPPSRVGERLNFTKLDALASTIYRVPNTRFTTLFSIKAQYAFNVVPSSETFGYGGIPFGYAYDPSEISGDRGIAARAELQCRTYAKPNLNLTSQVYVFMDGGYVMDINKTVKPTTQSGYSTGLGHRVNALQYLSLDFAVGIPLKPIPAANTRHKLRLLFNVRLSA